jgi:hypothetical protein
MTKKAITLGKKLFQFESKHDWILRAPSLFGLYKVTSSDTTCVDKMGRICTMGAHFTRAEKDNAYPIEVFVTQPDEVAAEQEKGQP